MAKMKLKLGLLKKDLPSDKNLITALFDTMEKTGADFTNTFRCLSRVTPTNCSSPESDEDVIEYLVSECISLQGMITACSAIVEWSQMMEMSRDVWKSSPNVITQIEMEAGKHQLEDEIRRKKVEQLQTTTQEEKENNDRVLWTEWVRTYKVRLDQECDQLNADEVNQERVRTMESNNPRFVLRNYIAQRAIQAAENGDLSVVQNILKRLETPYSEDFEDREASFSQTASTTNPSPSTDQKKATIFNISDLYEIHLHKPSDDALNMRLT